jgi:hypothetical protein
MNMAYSAEKYIPDLGRNFYFKPEHIDVRGGIDQVVPGLSNDTVEFDYDKHINAVGGAEDYIPHIGKLKFIHPRDVINKPAVTLTADTTGNLATSVIDITFTDDGFFGSQITKITKGGTTIPTTSYTITSGKISFIANTFTVGANAVVVTATGYKDSSVSQTAT